MSERRGPAVLAEGLAKRYKGREGTVEAVRGVDLEVRAGEIFGCSAVSSRRTRRASCWRR